MLAKTVQFIDIQFSYRVSIYQLFYYFNWQKGQAIFPVLIDLALY